MVTIKYRDSQKEDEVIDDSWNCVIEEFMKGCFRLRIKDKNGQNYHSRYIPLDLIEEIINE